MIYTFIGTGLLYITSYLRCLRTFSAIVVIFFLLTQELKSTLKVTALLLLDYVFHFETELNYYRYFRNWPNQNQKRILNINGEDGQTYLNKQQNYR